MLVAMNETPAVRTPSQLTPEAHASAVRTLGTWMLIRGVLGVVIGVIAVFWPREQLGSPANLGIPVATVDAILIAYFALLGIILLAQSRVMLPDLRTPVLGQAIVVVPALVFLLMASSAAQVRAAVCVWALLTAACEAWVWSRDRLLEPASDFLISAGVHALLGVILLVASEAGALSIFGFLGAASLLVGAFLILGGLTRRSPRTRDRILETGSADPAVDAGEPTTADDAHPETDR